MDDDRTPVTVLIIHEYGLPELVAYGPVVAEGHKTLPEMMTKLVSDLRTIDSTENSGQVDGLSEEQFRLMVGDSFEATVLHAYCGDK